MSFSCCGYSCKGIFLKEVLGHFHSLVLLSRVQLFATPGIAAHQSSLSTGILQARILEWFAIPFSRGSSQARDQNQVSCIAGRFLTFWATREATVLFPNVCVPNRGCWPCNCLYRLTLWLPQSWSMASSALASLRALWLFIYCANCKSVVVCPLALWLDQLLY